MRRSQTSEHLVIRLISNIADYDHPRRAVKLIDMHLGDLLAQTHVPKPQCKYSHGTTHPPRTTQARQFHRISMSSCLRKPISQKMAPGVIVFNLSHLRELQSTFYTGASGT
jgi:hypothetical protein